MKLTALTLALCLLPTALHAAACPKYSRTAWKLWIDADHDCQNTRDEVLIAESDADALRLNAKGCRVTKGRWHDPYSGEVVTDPNKLDIDHRVPLGHADSHGGCGWSRAKKQAYANDLDHPEHLVAVSASLNRQKGMKGPDEWLPPVGRCEYVKLWLDVKETWNLTLTVPEVRAIIKACGR